MKRIFTLLVAGLLVSGLNTASAQIDTLIWEDFQDTANVFVTGWDMFPAGATGVMNWTNFDADGLADANGRPQDWFLSSPWAPSDSALPNGDLNFVAGSSSWLTGYLPGNRNWMITPSFNVTDSTTRLFWKSAPRQTPTFLDGYSVWVSTTDNNESSFTNQVFCAGQYESGSGPIFSGHTFVPAGCFVHGEDGMFMEVDPTSTDNQYGKLRPFEVNLWQFIGQDIYVAFLHDSDDDNLISVDDIGVIKTTVINSVDDLSEKFNLNIYPNPASSKVQVAFDMPASSQLNISVFNVLGEKVKDLNQGEIVQGLYNYTIDVSDLAAGVYSLRLETEFGSTTQSIIVE